MQSGYGVSEISQFLADGLCSPLFPSPNAAANTENHPPPHLHHRNTTTQTPPYHMYHNYHHSQQQQHQHQLQQFYHSHPQPPPQPLPQLDPPPRFSHFLSAPITQQFFDQTTTHPFHLFDHQRRALHSHLGLDHDSPPPPTSPSPTAGAPPAIMNFGLAVNDHSGGGSKNGLHDSDGLLHADEGGNESPVNLWPPTREEDTAIKEPFWRPLDINYINLNRKRCEETEMVEEPPTRCMEGAKEMVPETEEATNSTTNYKLFSELEAICKPGGAAMTGNNTAGSSSALTGENRAVLPTTNYAEVALDHGSNASNGDDEGSLKNNLPKSSSTTSSKVRRRKRRKQQLSSILAFFESLVKQLMEHQEALHRRFLEVLENRDSERVKKEHQWRAQEMARSANEALARAEQQTVAAAREAAIVSFLEKITGQPLDLPMKAQFEKEEKNKQGGSNNNAMEVSDDNRAAMNPNRWPKGEVQALINVRSRLESRFQEPGLKGPLWEEVSSMMATMGYRRSAKRCKEKWENINKYFKKAKESNKKRSQRSKTCPYFHQLDKLYTRSSQNHENAMDVDRRVDSELLDAILTSKDRKETRNLEGNMHQEHEDDEDEDHVDEEEDDDDEEGEMNRHVRPTEEERIQHPSGGHSSLFF